MKRRIAALLAAAMLAAAAPTLAETMRIGDQAVVKKCKEYITLREADNAQATELARIPLGEQVIYLNPAQNGFALVEYGDTQGFVKAEYLGNQTARATPFAITEEERRNVNLFLTNFTETGMEPIRRGLDDGRGAGALCRAACVAQPIRSMGRHRMGQSA